MDTQKLYALLGSLSGHLISDSPQQEKEIKRLHKHLSRSLLHEEIGQLKTSHFVFENADLFSPENILPERLAALESIAEKKAAESATPEFHLFVREVPVRSTQFHASMPLWAGGAAVEHTIGPFTHKDGRNLWFDFFRIEKLVALYIQGRPKPAILFKISAGFRFIDINVPLAADLLPLYKLPAGSIWVDSEIFASNAPADYYTGLTIKGGTINLSVPPQLVNGKLTITPSTVVTVKLQLRQPAVTDADASSPYGGDARNAEIQLPKELSFHFSGLENSLDTISPARWNVYGHKAFFEWNKPQQVVYDSLLHRVLIPCNCSTATFKVKNCQSPFHKVKGEAPVAGSAWALPAAPIDILHPAQAAGIGALLVKCNRGLTNAWNGLEDGEINLNQPFVMAEPGRISITDLTAGNIFCRQTFDLWKDEQNPYGATALLQYPKTTPFFYITFANGNEALMVLGNADVQIDRPVTVAGEALSIRSKNTLLLLAANKNLKLIYLFDDNILFDSIDLTKKPPSIPKPIALALRNALFKVTPVNGCLLFGQIADDFVKVKQGFLYLTFGMFAYLPTLPDPYATNLGNLRSQFRGRKGIAYTGTAFGGQNIWLWLVCRMKWQPGTEKNDKVEVSFHFAPLQNQFQLMQTSHVSPDVNSGSSASTSTVSHPLFNIGALQGIDAETAAHAETAAVTSNDDIQTTGFTTNAMASERKTPDYSKIWDKQTKWLRQDMFAMLDVSTNADLLGVSFGLFGDRRMSMITTHAVVPAAGQKTPRFPLQVQDMDVVTQGINARAYTVPQISWEPVLNLTDPQTINPTNPNIEPPLGPNYYPDDGGPTRIFNNSVEFVPLSPIPLSNFVIDRFDNEKGNITASLFTLPFAIKAIAVLNKDTDLAKPPTIKQNRHSFPNNIKGGIQLQFNAGKLPFDDYPLFHGGTFQLNNILNIHGQKTLTSTLGDSVTLIFNEEFKPEFNDLLKSRGVPLTRIDFSGYGASLFSNWFNPDAQFAQTSQSKFDVFVGRTAHEVIQVRSMIYPWGIKVVRTIILYRVGSGYVYRVDTGWKAESDGRFDFSYKLKDPADPNNKTIDVDTEGVFAFHPGIVKGLFNIKNIVEVGEKFPLETSVKLNEYYVDDNNNTIKNTTQDPMKLPATLKMVEFDSDVEIEEVKQGAVNGKVPSKKITGFVQLSPRGIPLSSDALKALINRQLGSIGGPVDCVVDIHNSGQQIRLNRFDVSNSFAANGSDPVFVVAGRGNVILPKDGSWSMVKHQYGTGEVTPVPEDQSAPLIRVGKLIKKNGRLEIDEKPENVLLRIADPAELLRQAVSSSINYGFLQSTDTQKALFLTPSFKQGLDKLLSKTPPLFADAFRIVNSKAVFPNVGDAVNNFGDAVSLVKNGSEFDKNPFITDGGKQVLELMQINKVVNNIKQEGYNLLKKVEEFDLPDTEWKLIEIDSFKIYIEYKADKVQKPGGGTKNLKGALNFDVDSFAGSMADKWKSRMSNVALVVDLGPIDRLMTIKGNWDAKKGVEAQYKGGADFPSPQIEFAPELEPVIEILQVLQDLQGENYKAAFEKGLKLAMSNKAGTWEYKLEAAKEIPVVRFPVPDAVYNDPNTPLKLEAGLKLGAYFNAALKVTSDPSQLLPIAGGYLEFYGKLSVMCVSLSAATIYAVGQVNLKIAADTKTGPSLAMQFGFGAQIVVGLPVVGNVSVLYMVGVEIYIDSAKLNLSAFLLFRGHAELLGGIISVTITIEAKGTVSRDAIAERTDMAAQITFGLDISIFLVIDISFSTSWQEQRQIA